MKKLFGLILLSSTLFTGCKREYAFVQPAKMDVFVQKQRVKTLNQNATPEITLLEAKDPTPTEIAIDEIIPQAGVVTVETHPVQDQKPLFGGVKKKKKQVQSRRGGILMEKLFPHQQVKETQKRPVKKKKRKKIKRWNTMIPSGFIFLGIAILLSLINLNGLALLFGVAAILFLFLGFRKLFRKNRRRKIFR